MPDEKTQTIIWGALIAAVTGLYGLFAKHVFGHTDKAEITKEIDQLWNKKQNISECEQIVKRIDQNHEEIKQSLGEIKELIRNGR